jgi:hypothetical protein
MYRIESTRKYASRRFLAATDALLQASSTHIGFNRFLPGQREAIEHVLAGNSVVAVFPTEGGKSPGYQLPTLVVNRKKRCGNPSFVDSPPDIVRDLFVGSNEEIIRPQPLGGAPRAVTNQLAPDAGNAEPSREGMMSKRQQHLSFG